MSFRSFIRRWLVCGLCSGTGHAHNPHLSPAQAIGALVSSLGGDRADFRATPGKLAILVLAYEEVRERGWRGGTGPRQSAAFWTPARARREHADGDDALRPSHEEDGGSPGLHAYANAPVLDAVFSGTGSWVVPQPIPNWAGPISPQCCVIAA
ncbi:MAG TPA: hypothetical protein VFN81_00125 [Sphingomicrobium sp.]|nr:hypothetical protein [Sphingomicrobium sp.]